MADFCSLRGKNIVITGAGGSIGTQTAILFAKNGASTLLLSDVSAMALDKLKDTFRFHHPQPDCRLLFHTCDVSDENQVSGMYAQLDPHGGVDVAINNAGVFPTDLDGDAIGVTAAAWELTHKVNVLGAWLGSKHAVLSMRRHQKTKGSVVNVSSVTGLMGSATAQLAYTASKGAVIAMTRELGIVHARENYRFNTLCPAPLNNPLLNNFLDADDETEDGQTADGCSQPGRRQRREVHLPQGRFGEAIEVAGAALFLASDASAFVNATEMVVDGGLTKAFVTGQGTPGHAFLKSFATA